MSRDGTLETLLSMTEAEIAQDVADFEFIIARIQSGSGSQLDLRLYADLLETRRAMLQRIREQNRQINRK
jgi:hypothetical protein